MVMSSPPCYFTRTEASGTDRIKIGSENNAPPQHIQTHLTHVFFVFLGCTPLFYPYCASYNFPSPPHTSKLETCLFCLSGMHPIILPILLHCASYNFPSLHSAPAHHLPLDHILYIHYFSLDQFFSGKEGGSEDYQIIAVNGSVTILKKVH